MGISFLFRPLGAFLAGHFGDRLGRRAMLVITLILMGASTTLIGVLPTYETVGVCGARPAAAPAHPAGHLRRRRMGRRRPDGRRTRPSQARPVRFLPAARRPLGMLLASGVLALMSGVDLTRRGLRRVGLARSVPAQLRADHRGLHGPPQRRREPGFRGNRTEEAADPRPDRRTVQKHWLLVILAALVFAGNNAAGYMTTGGYILSYATARKGLAMDRTEVLLAVTASAALWFVFTLLAGFLADSIGRKKTYLIGYGCLIVTFFPLFWLINTGNIWAMFLGLALFTRRTRPDLRPAGRPLQRTVPGVHPVLRRRHLLRRWARSSAAPSPRRSPPRWFRRPEPPCQCLYTC